MRSNLKRLGNKYETIEEVKLTYNKLSVPITNNPLLDMGLVCCSILRDTRRETLKQSEDYNLCLQKEEITEHLTVIAKSEVTEEGLDKMRDLRSEGLITKYQLTQQSGFGPLPETVLEFLVAFGGVGYCKFSGAFTQKGLGYITRTRILSCVRNTEAIG